jgi:hypothetical protein
VANVPSLNLFGVRGRTSEREPPISPTNTSHTPTFPHLLSLLLNTEVMSTANLLNTQFDDSEEEDDNFNPQPADLSDAEDAGGEDHDDDAEDQIRGEAARQKSKQEGSDDEDAMNKEGDDDEDEEGEGEDTAPRAGDDEEEDEEEDEEDEEITVRTEEDYESMPLVYETY